MKKMSNKGFTLIELLAVITIMGILMMVAIPAVTRTIENARRDTFSDIAGEYINAVRNGVLADNIRCYHEPTGEGSEGKWTVVSAEPDGDYIFPICTAEETCADAGGVTAARITQSTIDIMESGGRSSFGNAEMQGYVKIHKATETSAADYGATGNTKITYQIYIIDSGNHGIDSETQLDELSRGSVLTSTTATHLNAPSAGTFRVCIIR